VVRPVFIGQTQDMQVSGKKQPKPARQPAAHQAPVHKQPNTTSGIWLTEIEYAERFRIARQTLSNWRCAEKHGQTNPTRPVWRKFGGAVRYYVPPQEVAWMSDAADAAEGCGASIRAR